MVRFPRHTRFLPIVAHRGNDGLLAGELGSFVIGKTECVDVNSLKDHR